MALTRIRHRRPIRSGNNSTAGEKIAERIHSGMARIFGGRIVASLAAIVAAFIVFVGGFFWYERMYTDPERVFWAAIDNNLSTYSVTKETRQEAQGNTTVAATQLIFNPDPILRSARSVTAETPQGNSKVTIESIGTPKDTYQHYTEIVQPGKDTKNYEKVYPMWLRNGGGDQSDAQLFNDAMFGALLFGNVSGAEKEKIISNLHSTYKVDFNSVKESKDGMRKVYVYDIKVSLKNYAKAANLYAKALELPNADLIKPESYKESDQLEISISVDVLSRQVKNLVYKTANATENYSGYGIWASPEIPGSTVDYKELQKTITEASK